MSETEIKEALREASDTRQVVIAPGALRAVADVFAQAFEQREAVVVCDESTRRVAGEAVERSLSGGLELQGPFVFPGRPVLYAEYGNVEALAESLRLHDAVPVGVGSGTVNDIVKRAAHECGRPYMTVATAASMDGYTAFGAAISRDGFKRTMECPAPRALVADLDILSGAPSDMTASGYGDLLAKFCSGADWIVADALEVEPIEPRVWSLVQDPLRPATADPRALADGDVNATGRLIEGLVLSGLAMQAHSSSRPASGAEHQFSHLWEMEGLGHEQAGGGPPLSHGFKVAVGTVAIGALYERVLMLELDQLDVEAAVGRWPSWPEMERRVRASHRAPELAEPAVEECRAKYLGRAELSSRLTRLRDRWPELRERLGEQLLGAGELARRLREAGAPSTPDEIGLSAHQLRDTYARAQTIRRRFTVLDLLDQTGLLEEAVSALFTDGGYWATHSGA